MACKSSGSVKGAGMAFDTLSWRLGAADRRAALPEAFMLCGLADAGCPCVDIGPMEGVVEADDGAGEGAKESGELTYAGLKLLSAAIQVLPLLQSREARPAARTGKKAQTAQITHSQAQQGSPLCCRRGARCARVHCSAGLQRQPLFPASLPPAEGRRARRAYEQKPVADKRHASSHEPGSSGWTHLAFAGAQAAAFALPRSVSLTASVRGWEHQMHTVSSCDGQGNYSHDLKITNSHRLNSWLKLGLEAGAKIQRINTPFTEVRDETTRGSFWYNLGCDRGARGGPLAFLSLLTSRKLRFLDDMPTEMQSVTGHHLA